MADFITPFDPTATSAGYFNVSLPNGGWLFLHNESPVELQVQASSKIAPVLIPAYTARCFHAPLGTNRVTWQQLAIIGGSSAAPISQVYGEAYAASEWTAGEFYVSLARQVNLGNQASGGGAVGSITNDGNAAGTSVIEATPSGQSASSISLNNDASGFLQVLSANVLRKVLNVVRGDSGSTKATITIGDAGDTSILTLHGTADSASSVPASGISSGTLPAGVTVPAANISGTVAAATSASSVPASGVQAGSLGTGVNVQGDLLTAVATRFVSFKDNAGKSAIEFDANAEGGVARGLLFAGMDSGGTLHEGFHVDGSGLNHFGASGLSEFLAAIAFNGLKTVVSGTTAGSATWSMPLQGDSGMLFLCFFSGYENATATPQNIKLPTPFASSAVALNLGVSVGGTSVNPKTSGGAAITFSQTTLGTGTSSGTQNGRTAVPFSTLGHVTGAIDNIDLPINNTGPCTGWFLLLGL